MSSASSSSPKPHHHYYLFHSPLLRALTPTFSQEAKKKKKPGRSIQQCLRSKTMPAVPVQNVLSQIQRRRNPPQNRNDNNNNDNDDDDDNHDHAYTFWAAPLMDKTTLQCAASEITVALLDIQKAGTVAAGAATTALTTTTTTTTRTVDDDDKVHDATQPQEQPPQQQPPQPPQQSQLQQHSSMYYCMTIATACHFCQFLIEYLTIQEQQQQDEQNEQAQRQRNQPSSSASLSMRKDDDDDNNNNQAVSDNDNDDDDDEKNINHVDAKTTSKTTNSNLNNNSNKTTTSMFPYDNAEMSNMIRQVCHRLSGVLVAILSARSETTTIHPNHGDLDADDDDDDKAADAINTKDKEEEEEEEEYFTANATVSFDARQVAAYGFGMILKLQYYVWERPCLLPGIWKALQHVAVAFATTTSSSLPPTLWSTMCQHLAAMITDGVDTLVAAHGRPPKNAAGNATIATTTRLQQELETQSQLLMYILSRFSLLIKTMTTSMSKSANVLADQLFHVSFLQSLLGRLVLLLGLCIMQDGQAVAQEQEQQQHIGNHKQQHQNHHTDLRGILSKLSGRAQAVVDNLVNLATNTITTSGLAHCLVLCQTVLVCEEEIESSPSSTEPSSSSLSSEQQAFQLETAMYTGKLYMQLQLLDAMTPSQKSRRQSLLYTYSPEILETCLRLVENVLFVTLPRTVGVATNNHDDDKNVLACDLVHETLVVVTGTLVFFGSSPTAAVYNQEQGSVVTRQFHFLLLDWIRRATAIDDSCHALTREVLVSTICQYMNSCQGQGREAFLGLVVSLVFDPRTLDPFRRLLVVLTIRLTQMDEVLKKTLEGLIAERVQTLLATMASRKRKRKSNVFRLSTSSLSIIHDVLPLACVETNGALLDSSNKQAVSIGLLTSGRLAESTLIDRVKGFVARSGTANKNSLVALGYSVLQALEIHLQSPSAKVSRDAIPDLVNLLELGVSDHFGPLILAKVVGLLSHLGSALPANTSRTEFEQIAAVFHNLLRSDLWLVRCETLNGFVGFATKGAGHKDLLRNCVPVPLQKTFGCRLKKTDLNPREIIFELRAQSEKALVSALHSRSRGCSIFPSPTTMHIDEESLVIKMPSQGGRHAIVIFPPGEQSREDIRSMLGADDEEEGLGIHMLRSVVVSGNGCKLSLSKC